MADGISPTVTFICAAIPCFICIIAVPLGFFLLWRTQLNASIYALSLQVRLQIVVWALNLTNILITTLYMFYFWMTPDDSETPWNSVNKTWWEMVMQRVESRELNVNKPLIFTLHGLYIMATNSCTISVTFIMIDRCFALMYPIYYTDRTKLILLRSCLGCIFTSVLFSLTHMIVVDWPNFVNVSCFGIYCAIPKLLETNLYFKITMTCANFCLAILFCCLLWKRNNNKMVLQHSSHYFVQRANLIAIWSVFTEFTFNFLPIFTLGVSVFFHVNTRLPIYGQFIMTGVALDGFCTILLYIKIVVFKRHRAVVNTISDFAVKFHHGFGIRKQNTDPATSTSKSHQIV